MSLGSEQQARIALTVSCRDTDVIPKVPEAGSVVDGIQVKHVGVASLPAATTAIG